MTLSKVEELIAQERGKLEDALAVAIEKRDVANREIKRLRAELDAAPRLHVRRTRRPSEALPGQGELPAQQERDLRRLPGAAELFPHGIERTGRGE